MVELRITMRESDLDNKLRKVLSEYQQKGVIDIVRVETSDYTMKNPTKKTHEHPAPPSPDEFVEAVEFIVKHAAHQNGHLIETNDKGVAGCYRFWLDASAWCDTMDKLLDNHRELIEAVLEHKQRADGVNLLAGFIGAIIDERLFQKDKGIRKMELLESFKAYYGEEKPSVRTKMAPVSSRWCEFHKMVGMVVKIAKGECD